MLFYWLIGKSSACLADWLNHAQKVFRDCLRRFFHPTGPPPVNRFNEGRGNVVYQIVLWQCCTLQQSLLGVLGYDQRPQVGFEVFHKNLIVFRGQELQNISVVFLQVPHQMQKHGVRLTAAGIMIMSVGQAHSRVDDMPEQFLAQGFQQRILRLKMGIEGCSSHIGYINNLLHGDLIVLLLGKQLRKSGENCILRFSLPSVHVCLPNNSRNLFRTE